MAAPSEIQNDPASEQLGDPLPAVLQPEDGVSFWRPQPTNGHVTVKTSPSYGGPPGITMGTQTIPPGCFVAEHSHDRQVEILFCYAGKGMIEVDGATHRFEPGTTVIATPWLKHKIINPGPDDLKMTVQAGVVPSYTGLTRQALVRLEDILGALDCSADGGWR